jgi:hypothetical protein
LGVVAVSEARSIGSRTRRTTSSIAFDASTRERADSRA